MSDNKAKNYIQKRLTNFLDTIYCKYENVKDNSKNLILKRYTDGNNNALFTLIGVCINNATTRLGSSLYKYTDEISWIDIYDITETYSALVYGEKIDIYEKASALMTSIILSNIIEDKNDRIVLAIDSSLILLKEILKPNGNRYSQMDKYRFIPNYDDIIKCIKYNCKVKDEEYSKKNPYSPYGKHVELTKEFKPLMEYMHKLLLVGEKNNNTIDFISRSSNAYNTYLEHKDDEIRDEDSNSKTNDDSSPQKKKTIFNKFKK